MSSHLEQLTKMTVVVADTGDLEQIKKFKPTDATTNPSLMLAAASNPKFDDLVESAIAWGAAQTGSADVVAATMDKLAVTFGVEILKIVSGVVSTEVDARLSFDTDATVARARALIALYEAAGVPRARVLVKIAATWEGIRAAETLEKEGITCNLTLLFSFAQAVACAEAGVTLISPFVGRIMDWYAKKTGETYADASKDPGVESVTRIYNYYKTHGYKTVVMGASFRNAGQITQLAGCDKLTIAPALLEKLQTAESELPQRLSAPSETTPAPATKMTEAGFRWAHNEDAMATEKLAEGIRAFAVDCAKLEKVVTDRLKAKGVAL
jgi:transaldolase